MGEGLDSINSAQDTSSSAGDASLCLKDNHEPEQIHQDVLLLRTLQSRFATTGVPLVWPWEGELWPEAQKNQTATR